jgi:hypothetical protein
VEEEEKEKEEEEEEKEEEEEEEEGDKMSIDLLSIDSNEPDFFNDGSDEIVTDNVDAVFDIKYPPKNEDKASKIIISPLNPMEWACLDFYIELLNQRII